MVCTGHEWCMCTVIARPISPSNDDFPFFLLQLHQLLPPSSSFNPSSAAKATKTKHIAVKTMHTHTIRCKVDPLQEQGDSRIMSLSFLVFPGVSSDSSPPPAAAAAASALVALELLLRRKKLEADRCLLSCPTKRSPATGATAWWGERARGSSRDGPGKQFVFFSCEKFAIKGRLPFVRNITTGDGDIMRGSPCSEWEKNVSFKTDTCVCMHLGMSYVRTSRVGTYGCCSHTNGASVGHLSACHSEIEWRTVGPVRVIHTFLLR